MMQTFKALQVVEEAPNHFSKKIIQAGLDRLPPGDTLIQVHYSSLNYKDALSASGNRGVTRNYPHTPGIDAAGIVAETTHPSLQAGQEVIVTGYDLGMNTWGGLGEYIRVPGDWAVALPQGLSLRESMIHGTAGFTAALSVYKLTASGVKPEDGPILVTGATGGVGSISVALLAKLGYKVTAATGKASEEAALKALGAEAVIDRHELDDASGKPMLKGRWAGAIDTVGGNILATVIKTLEYGGSVTSCGNVASPQFNTSVFPFILRGVNLLGVDSVNCPVPLREKLWTLLAGPWKLDYAADMVTEVALEEVPAQLEKLLKGSHTGRTLVKVNVTSQNL